MPGLLVTRCRVRGHIHGLFRLSSVHIVMELSDIMVESDTDQGLIWPLHCVIGSHEGSLDSLSRVRANLNLVMFVIRNVSLPLSTVLVMFT
jgi:hypothetical protein